MQVCEKMIRLNNPQYFDFLQRADALRLSRSLCDAVITVDNHVFHAHRLVLACASRALARQMERDCPLQCPLGLSVHTFRQVLDFSYTQVLEVREKDLPLLLRAAQSLEMEALEEQCRKQLASLQHSHDTEESTLHSEAAALRDREVKENNLDSKCEEQNECTEEEKSCTSDCADDSCTSPKKLRLSPVPAHSKRDSVITSSNSPFSPWAFPAHVWSSVDTWRQIAHNYSTLMSAQRAPNPSITRPLSVSAHVLPLLSSAFQRPAQASVMSYSHLHPLYSTHSYTAAPRAGGFIKQGLLKRRKQKAVSLTSQSCSYMDEAKADAGRECQHCSVLPQDSVCRFCGKGATQTRGHSHEAEQRMDKPYHCKHCSKRFSLKHQLDTHHRVHTGEKPFECRLCGQRSRDYSAMIKHLRTHGGAAPYQCTVCLEYCSSLVAMQRHVKSHALHEFPTDWSIGSTYMYRSHI